MDLPTKLDVQKPSQKYLACPARFERATYALEGRCSIQLSYGQMDFLDFNGMLEPWEFGIGL